MRLGFAKSDLTPRVGIELCGFGPFINRHSIAVRDRLWARAMAVEVGEKRAVIISNDLVMVAAEDTARIRQIIGEATGLAPECIMVHCTHTHSGPNTSQMLQGWGVFDMPGRVGEWTRDVYLTDTSGAAREPGTLAYIGASDLTSLADVGTIHGGSSLILNASSLALASARCAERNYPASSATDTLTNGTTRAHPFPNGKSSGWGFRCCQFVK